MNILQVQDDLKNFSQQQLVQEMKQPKGVAPQFLVLGEITRRKRMSDDMKTRGAADQKTVAQDVVSAAQLNQTCSHKVKHRHQCLWLVAAY